MVKLYVLRVQSGKMSLEEVPERWREAVEIELSK